MKRLARRRGVRGRMWHGFRFPALVGAYLLLAALPLAACSSGPPADRAAGFAGYAWQVVSINHDGTVSRIPERLQVSLQFSPDGQFGAHDSVNLRSGVYRTNSDGFTVSGMRATLAGYAGHDPTVLLAISAIGSFSDGARATAKLTGNQLVVGVGSYTLTCQRRSRSV